MAGSMAACFAAMFFLRIEYRRMAVDRRVPLEDAGSCFDRAVGCY